MDVIDMQDFERCTAEILQRVYRDGASFEVTEAGQPIARVIPARATPEEIAN